MSAPARGRAVAQAQLEADRLRAEILRLLAHGVGENTPIEIQQQVAHRARRLAELEPAAYEIADA